MKQTTTISQETLLIAQATAKKYGWEATEIGTGFSLTNRNGIAVCHVSFKGEKYTFNTVRSGDKLLTGRGQLAKSMEKVLDGYFYALKNPE